MTRVLYWALGTFALALLAVVTTAKLEPSSQVVFMIATLVAFFALNLIKTRAITLVLVVLSITVSTRYLYWRLTETLAFDTFSEAVLGSGLFLAEFYAYTVLVLGFIQSVWPLHRRPVPLPDDIASWPKVDVYIPTYNESLQVVSNTVLGAMSMDYPADRFNVYLLDDGRRPEFEAFAREVGCGYITRADNRHAKAGNLNAALAQTDSELIAIFDSDHVPTRSFLQMTVGGFLKNDRLALVQTPHHFYSPDPFERNVSGAGAIPNEGQLFYGLVQEGNDFWGAAFFCGSCAVLRRSALESVGGFATETVTEDAHTALKMHRHGWESSYIRLPLAAGLATERLALHIGQRLRWARGMTQIFRMDNPLFGQGLSFPQRLCYLNAMLHFFFALPRFVFLTAPLAYLLFEQNIIVASWDMIFIYAVPHLVHAVLTNSRLQSRHRYTFWGEIYESVLSFHIMRPTLVTLINPRRGVFNVTDKGGLLPKGFFDSSLVAPHMVLAGFLIFGLLLGVARLALSELELPLLEDVNNGVITLNMAWAMFNLILVLAAISVAREKRQVRAYVRVPLNLETRVTFADGTQAGSHTVDMSMGGALCELEGAASGAIGEHVQLDVSTGSESLPVIGTIVGVSNGRMRVRFDQIGISQQRNLVRLVFGRADAWLGWDDHKPDSVLRSFGAIFRGIGGMLFGSGEGRGRRRATQAAMLALIAGLGVSFVGAPGTAKAQGARTGEVVIGVPIVRDEGTTRQAPEASAPVSAPAAPVMAPIRQTNDEAVTSVVPGQNDGVAGQDRPAEPSPFVVPNVQLENAPYALVPEDAPVLPDGPLAPLPGGGVERVNLKAITGESAITLKTAKGVRYIPFTLRRDRLIDYARLRLSFNYSPSLLPELSNLSVFLNEAPVGRMRLIRSHAGGATVELPIDGALFRQENAFRLQSDAHYTTGCEDPMHDTLWLEVNAAASAIEMAVRPLQFIDDLAILPRPFVDPNSRAKQRLTFVLPPSPSDRVLEAAGVVASYFGANAPRHGLAIDVLFGGLAPGNAVIFAAGDARPRDVDIGPAAGKTQIYITSNPMDTSGAKVLILSGADEAGLVQAARRLALADQSGGLRGPSVVVDTAPVLKARAPDDAARWIPLDRPISLGEMVKRAEELQGEGVAGFLSAPFIMPPRNFPDKQGGPTLKIEFDYPTNGLLDQDESRLDVLLSDKYVKTLPLRPAEAIDRVAETVRGQTDEEGRAVVRLDPSILNAARNELQFYFTMSPKKGKCLGALPQGLKFRVQPSSTIDFGNTINNVALPELAHFASVGYPFTRMADLSETVVVLPAEPAPEELSTYLNVMAMAGEATGDVAAQVSVARPDGLGAHPKKDVLIIGAWSGVQGALTAWGDGGMFHFESGGVRVRSDSPIESLRYFFADEGDRKNQRQKAGQSLSAEERSFTGLASFERPDASGRVVVLLSGVTPRETLSLLGRIDDPDNAAAIKGDLVRPAGDHLASFAIGPQFTISNIPFFHQMRWFFADRPLLLVAMLFVGVALLTIALYWMLQRIAAARIGDIGAD